jgi:hypothetical protein
MAGPSNGERSDVWTVDLRSRFDELLDEYRASLHDSLGGLTEEEARLRLVPSKTTVLGLVKHVTYVEGVWFDQAISGRSYADIGIPTTYGAVMCWCARPLPPHGRSWSTAPVRSSPTEAAFSRTPRSSPAPYCNELRDPPTPQWRHRHGRRQPRQRGRRTILSLPSIRPLPSSRCGTWSMTELLLGLP